MLIFVSEVTVADELRRDHNQFRIKQTSQDSDPSSTKRATARDQKIHISLPNQNQRTMAVEFVAVLLVLLVPLYVHAGFFSALAGLFAKEAEAELAIAITHQAASETPLLSALTNPKGATGGGEVYVEDGALVATGPVGEDAIATSPYRSGEISVYTVKESDTLSQIAEMYGVTTNTIMWANNLTSRTIHAGDVLVILPIAGVQHTVEKGETLASIVKKYEGDIDEVIEYNHLASADDVTVGDTVIIPGGEIAAPAVTVATPTKTSGGGGSSAGFTHPAPGAIKTQGVHGYNGIDFAVPGHGSVAIVAAAAGEVIVSKSGGWNGGYGNYIVVKHNNGTQTLYAHLSKNYVGAGEWVSAGQQIGWMGNTGRSTGTHLHFEVRGARNPF